MISRYLAYFFVILILATGLAIGLTAAGGVGSPIEVIRHITGTG